MFGKNCRNITQTQLARFLSTAKPRTPIPTQTAANMSSLFSYTSGRWLWNQQEQLEARYRCFNIPGLEQAACRAIGAKQCTSLEKIGEGNYNKAYRLVMDDGRSVIAKIPHPNAGPPTLTTASEVATMEFAGAILNIPVPKVLAWSATDQNPVNAEYIIMEEAKGSQLHDVWQNLQLRSKVDVIHEIVDIERKLLSVTFNRIGALYFNGCGISGCKPLVATVDSEQVNDRIQPRFCIGPIVRREFWEKERSTMHQYHGPWQSSVEYLESIANREISWIETYADPQQTVDNPWRYTSAEQHSPEAHVSCLRKFLSAIPQIVPRDSELISPRLWHPDFHAGNIYVDDQGRITSIIDWQGAWATPVFLGANPPLLLDYGVDMLMKLPDNFKSLDEATKNRFREWEYFASNEPCPYHFSAEEVRKHREEAESFNENQQFWEDLRGTLTDEGYTLNETYGAAVEVLKSLRDTGLARFKGEERNEFDKQTQWVLDLDKEE
ncbi:hypothetical protein DV735_g5946, partial [Chaetothyriales sp. CBS 134920]